MDPTVRREGRLIAAGIGIFVLSMLIIFAVVVQLALRQLDRIYGELEEFTETEISLTRIMTRVQRGQSAQHLALERLLLLDATESDRQRAIVERASVVFRKRGHEIARDLERGVGIARAAGLSSRDSGDDYRHLERLLLELQDDQRAFEARAAELSAARRPQMGPERLALLEAIAAKRQDTRRGVESLMVELEGLMEESGWRVEAHGSDAIRKIGWMAAGGAAVVLSFGAYMLLMTLSHVRKRTRVEVALRSSEARHRADLSTLQESAAKLATLATEDEIRAYVESALRAALDVESAEIGLDPEQPGQAVLSEPLSFGGETLGSISCGVKRSGLPFSPEERQLLQSMAEQTAVALHNARVIGALQSANDSLLRNARLVAVGEFAGAVAHGIRNPLAGIRAAAQAALKRAEPGPSAETLTMIMSETDRLDRRIRSLHDFSRPYEVSPRTTDLCGLLRSVAATIGRLPESAQTRIVTKVPDAPVLWDLDPESLDEALVELGVNALRAMPEGGELRLTLELRGQTASITVEDTGSGISEAVRSRVFDLFFTTRSEGTGMGLATVKKIIEAHRGTLELERTGPSGTVFRVELVSAS